MNDPSNNFGLTCSKEDASELTRLLTGSIQRLLNLKQWNDIIRLQAIDDPFRFIADVQKHCETLEKEVDSKGAFHILITGLSAEGLHSHNKIPVIKTLRQLMGWGLADSKHSCEALPPQKPMGMPTGFAILTEGFNSRESLEASEMWKTFPTHFFSYEIVNRPMGTLPSQPYKT